MTDFKNGGVPSPDYDSEDINYVHKKTEFTNDVYVYGKLYANLVGGQPDVNIKDFGAVGDGINDDTAAIQKALNQSQGKGRINIPEGTFIVSETIIIPSNTHLSGEGKDSVIKMKHDIGRDTTLMRTGERGIKKENIVLENFTLDFNRDRWGISGGETLKDTDGGDQDNDQTTLSICFSEYVLVKNVRCIDGYKHNIDVCAPRYPENNNGSTYDNEPSRYVTLQNCFTSGSGDDNITTHFSSDILIKGCRSIHPSGIRTEQNCNCFEIDDGSRNVTMINCTAIGGHKGLQIKGHSYAPAPYNVVVDDFKTYNNTTGIDIKHMDFDTGNSPTARNVNLSNIVVAAPRDFTSEGGVTELANRGIRISSYEDVKLVNVYVSDDTVDMADDFLASSTTRSRGIVRVMEGASNVMFKNLNIVGFAATSEGFWSSTSTKGPLIVDGFSSTNGPDKAFRITGAGSTGSISNYMISGSQSSGEGIDVEGTEFEVGRGIVTGYGTSVTRKANHGYMGSEKPAFLAELTTTQTNSGNVNAFLRNFDTVRFNFGNGWNNTTGKFTAPVAGLYKFNLDMTMQNGDAAQSGNTGGDDSIGVYWRVENNSTYYNRVHSGVRDFHSINPRFESGSGLEVTYSFNTIEQLDKGATVGWYQTDWDVDGVQLHYATITGHLLS